jgi:hypothetical protein
LAQTPRYYDKGLGNNIIITGSNVGSGLVPQKSRPVQLRAFGQLAKTPRIKVEGRE